ncbi:MAG: hypothetical protein HXX15_01005 [Rhodopseudomonas sp.]|uniref:hypothetical protein n=1 Tax=Rhodopseudomonas sp. TaxID=1078 RepID=UPI0017CEFD55|nr:hypothetical protein [Rhodopseudomonas sp.]NVN84638.1 hypothetical protein [Rhodopseudomonas sp.]
MSWYLYAIVVGLILPWIIATYRILAAFRLGIGAGLLKWLTFSAISIPIMLAIMWGIQLTK